MRNVQIFWEVEDNFKWRQPREPLFAFKSNWGEEIFWQEAKSEIVLFFESDLKQVNGEYCKVVMWIIKTWLEGEGRQQQIYRSPSVSSIKKNRCFPKFIAVIRKEWMYSETTAYKFKEKKKKTHSNLHYSYSPCWAEQSPRIEKKSPGVKYFKEFSLKTSR